VDVEEVRWRESAAIRLLAAGITAKGTGVFGHRGSIRAVIMGVPIALVVVAAGLILALPSAQVQVVAWKANGSAGVRPQYNTIAAVPGGASLIVSPSIGRVHLEPARAVALRGHSRERAHCRQHAVRGVDRRVERAVRARADARRRLSA